MLNYQPELTTSIPSCCIKVGENLINSAWLGDYRAIRGLLLCPNADINVMDKKGRTPLYLASWMNHIKVIDILLNDTQIDANIGNFVDQNTPFSIASKKNHFEVMEKLINHVKTDEGKGWSVDCWALQSARPEIKMEVTKTPNVISTIPSRGQ